MASAPATTRNSVGLAYWMQKTIQECDNAAHDFSEEPVHDLRVALRRCRSIADSLRTLDPDPAWKKMKKAGKRLFSEMGALRDVQVMQQWIEKLGAADDPVTAALLLHTRTREAVLKSEASAALQMFDRKQWQEWSEVLPERIERIPIGSLVFQHLALERWHAARELHRRVLRNRTKVAIHSLRIGIKKFRYIVENFLPQLHQHWGDDLKHLQDLLGDIHDLDVLWALALEIKAFPDPDAHDRWRTVIEKERGQRLEVYRAKMLGKHTLWQTWRAALPQGNNLENGALERMKLWASFLDPDFSHAGRVSKLALQVYDGLASSKSAITRGQPRARSILQVAALLHGVGRAKREKGHQKASYKLIRKMNAPLNWQPQELRAAALVARYYRGALPKPTSKRLSVLSHAQKRQTMLLAGILRLTDAVDRECEGKIRSLRVEETGQFITIWAKPHLDSFPVSVKIAAARCLLETAYQCPVIVRPAA